jgi:uncharacterized protein (DUF433 family)
VERIEVNPAICSGKPVMREVRIMARSILGMFAGGDDMNRIIASYPELTPQGVSAAVEYAARAVDSNRVVFP